MSQKTEAHVLADTFENTRALTRWYISKLKDVDMKQEFEVNGKKLNSAYWILLHLVWSENFLLLQCLDGKGFEIPWFEHVSIGKKLSMQTAGLPEVKEVLNVWKDVHATAMQHVRGLSDETLEKENHFVVGFAGDSSKRMAIHHAIRHEGLHIGQLAWLCKLYGIETV